jgi:excisionase family DNA binding protein
LTKCGFLLTSCWALQPREPDAVTVATLDPPQTDQQTAMSDKIDDALETRPAKVMTLEEVSRYLHVHPSTLYRLLKRGEIPAFRIGSDWRFNIETIDLWRSKLEMKH